MYRSLMSWALLVLYLVMLLLLTLHANQFSPGGAVNLVPFKGLHASLTGGRVAILVNVIGNIVVFLPLGFLMGVWLTRWCSLLRISLLGAGLSLSIEIAQFFFTHRVSDIDDVLLNTLGAASGYLGYQVLSHWVGSQAHQYQQPTRR